MKKPRKLKVFVLIPQDEDDTFVIRAKSYAAAEKAAIDYYCDGMDPEERQDFTLESTDARLYETHELTVK